MASPMPYAVRPLGSWIGPRSEPRPSPFRAGWSSTHDLIDREIWALGGRTWILQIDATDSQIRRDGGLRADARPASAAVRVVFDSRHGTLTYACDRYTKWQDNVRAIALSLEALRAVDRYGVAKTGEQYRGWTEIAARPAVMSREQAAEFLAHWAGLGTSLDLFEDYPNAVQAAYRAAAKRCHPDVSGDDGDTMARLNTARDLLLNGAGHGGSAS